MAIAQSDIFYAIEEHLFAQPEWRPRPNLLTERVVVVTGAITGLGLETAIQLGRLNASLVLLARRNAAKGEEAKVKVLLETGLAEARVVLWGLNLARLRRSRQSARKS